MLKVMIAEDDLMMADMLADVLTSSGYEVCGIARTVQKAVELNERYNPDLAVVDIRLAEGGLGTDIAAQLSPKSRPGILYAAGHAGLINLTKADGEACLSKPFPPADIIRALKIVEQIVSTGEASQPYPHKFHVLSGSPVRESVEDSNTKDREIDRLRQQQAALARFGSFALVERNLGTVLKEAARVSAEGLAAPFCKVSRYRSEERDFIVEAGYGWRQGVVGQVVSLADGSAPHSRAFATRKPIICLDLHNETSFVLPSFYAEHGIISTLSVLIRGESDRQTFGVLEIDSPIIRNYDQHDIDFLTGFANVLADAVIVSKRNAMTQDAVHRMEALIDEKDRLIAAKNSLLIDKNRLLEERKVLTLELQHRVRNNLQLIHGMLGRQLQHTTDAEGKQGIGGIARRVMTLSYIYDHFLATGISRTIDFGTFLSSLCAGFATMENDQHPYVHLRCCHDSVMLDLDDATALGIAVSELIANSYAHAFPDATGTISVVLVRNVATGEGILTFSDDGIGFSDSSGDRRHGLGLMRRLVEQIGGSATLRSEPNNERALGSEWSLKFPVR
jgi:two-component sensor histidine kinase/CheY-like chemotaxis protein